MKLPFKETTRTLGDTYNLAIERFSLLKRFLEKKKKKKVRHKAQYTGFLVS
jgi:hypothetical protein